MICLICPLSEYPKWQDGTIVTLFLTPFVIKDQRQSSMISLSWNIDTNWDFRLSFINCKVAQWIEIHHEEQKLMLICFEYISCQYPIHRNFCLNLERQKLMGKKPWYEKMKSTWYCQIFQKLIGIESSNELILNQNSKVKAIKLCYVTQRHRNTD